MQLLRCAKTAGSFLFLTSPTFRLILFRPIGPRRPVSGPRRSTARFAIGSIARRRAELLNAADIREPLPSDAAAEEVAEEFHS